MSGVVLRCPHCGTTRAAPGECEACHEATVRYYCTNHDPGRWLEARSCSVCGANFGDPPRAPAPPAAARPPAVRPSASARGPAAGGPPRARVPMPSPPTAAPRAPTGWPPRDRSDRPTIDVGTWERGDVAPPHVEVDLAPAGRALRGCLMRLLLLGLVLMLGVFGVLSLLGGSLLRLFGAY